MRRWGTALLAIVLLVAGCDKDSSSSAGSSPEKQQVDTLRALPFGDAAQGVVNDVLARAGVGLHEDNAEVTTGQPVRVTRWQARNLAVDAANGGGVPGDALNALAPVPQGAPPVPYLVAAWVTSYDSPSARFARELMGEQDWKHADTVLFPNLVITLFLADALKDVKAPAEPKAQSMALAGMAAAGVCSFAAGFIQHAIVDVAQALKVNTGGGGFFGFLGKIWNVAVDLAAGAVQGLLKTFAKPVVDLIADGFGVVATILQLSSLLTNWRADLKPEPSHNRFGVDSEVITGQFQLAVTQNQPPIPDFIVECAGAVNVDLRDAGSAAGSKVTWTQQNFGRGDLSTRMSADDALSPDKTARYRYQTGQESSELAKSPDTESPALLVKGSVQRNDIQKTRELFTKLLFDQLPSQLHGIVESLAKPLLDAADSKLASITAVNASARTFITYHVPEKKTPTPPPNGAGSGGNGKKAVWPQVCPDVGVITRASPRPGINAGPWEFDGPILPEKLTPPGGKTCGYSAWLGQKDPVTGFQTAEQIGIFLYLDNEPMPAGARAVTIAGTDRAWFEGPLKVIVGGHSMGISITIREGEDPEATMVAVAKEVLGVS
jgi:hypothetical protein